MISIKVRTNTISTTIVTTLRDTPSAVFEKAGAGTAGGLVNINGTQLTAGDLEKTFAEIAAKYAEDDIGIADGATISLACVVKADGN